MRRLIHLLALLSVLPLASEATAGLLSKTYQFKKDVTLQLTAVTDDGLRVDTVRFEFPAAAGGRFFGSGGNVSVEVAISNTGSTGHKVGIAVALFDDQERLLGVASGGSRLVALKADRQKSFRLIFGDVNGEALRAETFKISVESKP